MYRRTSAPEPGLGLGQILARRLALGYPGMEEEPPSMLRQIQILLADSHLQCSEGLLCNLNRLLAIDVYILYNPSITSAGSLESLEVWREGGTGCPAPTVWTPPSGPAPTQTVWTNGVYVTAL